MVTSKRTIKKQNRVSKAGGVLLKLRVLEKTKQNKTDVIRQHGGRSACKLILDGQAKHIKQQTGLRTQGRRGANEFIFGFIYDCGIKPNFNMSKI